MFKAQYAPICGKSYPLDKFERVRWLPVHSYQLILIFVSQKNIYTIREQLFRWDSESILLLV
jgi:hypothetical protein